MKSCGRLRERVPLAPVDARRHQEVARPLGRRAGQHGGFDLDEAALVEDLAHPEGDLVAEHEVLLRSPAGAGRDSGTRGGALPSRSSGPRPRRAASASGPGTRAAGPRPRRRRSAARDCAGPRRAGRPRLRSRRRPRCAPRGRGDRLRPGSAPCRRRPERTAPVADREEDELAEVAAAGHPAVEKTVLPASAARSSPAGWPAPGHRSLAAPRRSASCGRGKVSCSPVERSLTVTVASSRSRDPRSTACTAPRRRRTCSGSVSTCEARARPLPGRGRSGRSRRRPRGAPRGARRDAERVAQFLPRIGHDPEDGPGRARVAGHRLEEPVLADGETDRGGRRAAELGHEAVVAAAAQEWRSERRGAPRSPRKPCSV